MKKITALVPFPAVACAMLALCMLLSVCGCGKADKWQEQYDLGVKYLDDGNYDEAVVAFKAAIKIDPRRAEAYSGAAKAYTAQGDYKNAREILEEGYNATNDKDLQEELNDLTASDYPLREDFGQTVKADLDGDGQEDEIVVTAADANGGTKVASFRINGTDFSDLINNGLDYPIEYLDTECFALTDIDASDGKLEIALLDYGPSDDSTSTFFRYDGRSLTCLGNITGLIFQPASNPGTDDGAGFDGRGTVSSYIRLSVLQTWFASCDWRVGANGQFAPVPQELYYPINDQTYPVTALTDVTLYSDNSVGSAKTTLRSGGKLTVIATDNAQWALCRDADGGKCWLHLTSDGQKIDTPRGTVYAGQALDGLVFAD